MMKQKDKLFSLYLFYCFAVGMLGFPLLTTMAAVADAKPGDAVWTVPVMFFTSLVIVFFRPLFLFRGFRQMIRNSLAEWLGMIMVVLFGFLVAGDFFAYRLWPWYEQMALVIGVSAEKSYGPFLLLPVSVLVIYLDLKLQKVLRKWMEEQ